MVFGIVTTSGNLPVEGARVLVLEQAPTASATTDANGGYSISGVMASPTEGMSPLLGAFKPGYFTDLRFADPHYAPIAEDKQLDFVLEPWVSISLGQVVRGQAGRDAICSHWGYGTGTCQRFALTVPAAGTLEITISSPVANFDVDVVGPDGRFVTYAPGPSARMRLQIPVDAGATYEIRLPLWGGAREFELTTGLR